MQTKTAEKFATPKARFHRGALPQFRAFASNARTALADASGADRAAIAAELVGLEQRLGALRELAEGNGTFEHRKAELAQHRAEWESVRGTSGPVEDAAIVQLSEAVSRLLLTPAPDLQALAFKLRVFAEYEVHEDADAGEAVACLAEDAERLAHWVGNKADGGSAKAVASRC